MPSTEIGRPGRYDADLDEARRRRRDPAARASVLCGLVAFGTIFVPPARVYGVGACVVALLLAVIARRRNRLTLRQGSEIPLAGLILAAFAGIGLVASASAFGSVAAPAPSVAPSVSPDGPPAAAPGNGQSGRVAGTDLDVVFGVQHVELEDSGLRTMNLPVTVTNRSDRSASFDIDFEARDAAGKSITTDTAYVPNLAAGQSAQLRVFNLVNDRLLEELGMAGFVVTGAVAY